MRGKFGLKHPHYLWWVTGINGLLMFLIGWFFPKWLVFVLLLMGFFTFYLAYSVQIKNEIWLDLRPFIATLLGSSISSALFILTYNLSSQLCCPNVLRTQIFTNYAYPFVIITVLWITERLSVLIKELRK